jgi:hypothetical protein
MSKSYRIIEVEDCPRGAFIAELDPPYQGHPHVMVSYSGVIDETAIFGWKLGTPTSMTSPVWICSGRGRVNFLKNLGYIRIPEEA